MWKAHVLPLLQQHIAEQVDSMTTFMLLQHEAAVANLLEVSCSRIAAPHTALSHIDEKHAANKHTIAECAAAEGTAFDMQQPSNWQLS